MIQIEVATRVPEPAAGQITAWIDLGGSKSLASKKSLEAHPGWEDVAAQRAEGAITKPYVSASSPRLLVLPGAAAGRHRDPDKVRVLAAQALDAAAAARAGSLVFLLDTPRGAQAAADLVEGLVLHDYSFDKYKKPSEDAKTLSITLVVPGNTARRVRNAVASSEEVSACVNRARDLVNEPGSVATPAEIQARAEAVAEQHGLEIEVLDKRALKRQGYEGLLAVGRGSDVPPRMIVIKYRPERARKGVHLGLLGKGVTFDTGGVSIKPASKMWEMKGDMGGAAAVLYALDSIVRAKVRLAVTVIIVTSQNYVDAKSIVPGDIMRARNGKTIMIDNTDAEGRLILTDGLWRAGEEEVTHLVDVATLTGAIVRAIGPAMIGSFGNNSFVDRVTRASEAAGEPCWKMPMHEEYVDLIKSDIADVNNIASQPNGGAITAALFLREFVPEGVSWTHLDIAGPFIVSSAWKYFTPGATGVGVRALAAVAAALAEKGK